MIFILLLSITAAMAQGYPSHDHEPPQYGLRRVKRSTPAITNPQPAPDLNPCHQTFRGFESKARLREMRREKRDCLREQRKGRR